jgi:hypothetical protein
MGLGPESGTSQDSESGFHFDQKRFKTATAALQRFPVDP